MSWAWFWDKIQNESKQCWKKESFRKSSTVGLNKPQSRAAAVLAMSSAGQVNMRLRAGFPEVSICTPAFHPSSSLLLFRMIYDVEKYGACGTVILGIHSCIDQISLMIPASQLNSTRVYFLSLFSPHFGCYMKILFPVRNFGICAGLLQGAIWSDFWM